MNTRKNTHSQFSRQEFDILIIGGGITGAGVALDAASRGMRVALVEQHDFASGTSSRSTKLIHGGLRYLKQFELGLVHEVGRERAILHRLARHLVIPEKMLLPLIEGGTFGKWATTLGLFTYDLLAGVRGDDRFRMLSAKETMEVEPLLPREITLGAGLYSEYRTDDARLTIEVMKSAARHGATVLNYVKAIRPLYKGEKMAGAHCRDMVDGSEFEIRARVVVNATGPWSDEWRELDHSLTEKRMFPTKGVHLVFRKASFPIRQAMYFDVADGRMIFAIPRLDKVYVGTTDTPYHGDLDHIQVENEDIQYLLDAVNAMFPSIHLTVGDMVSSWAGVRPLIFEEGKSASEISRKDEIFVSDSGLITIAGGKLTGYRAMAERTVDKVAKVLARRFDLDFDECKTEKIFLTPSPFLSAEALRRYRSELSERLQAMGIGHRTDYLLQNYGRQCDEILDWLAQNPGAQLIDAERAYTRRQEWVVKEEDFLMRRTGRALFG